MSIIEENLDYRINLDEIYENKILNFESLLDSVTQRICSKCQSLITYKLNLKRNKLNSNEEELQSLIDNNYKLKHAIEVKRKEVKQQQTQYETYKQDQKLLTTEIKETHEAFSMAKKYYKKNLKFYFKIESSDDEKQIIFVQFFTESRKETDNFSVRLMRHTNSGKYSLTGMTPRLKMYKDIQRHLQESNCVPGALSNIRQAFIKSKGDKV